MTIKSSAAIAVPASFVAGAVLSYCGLLFAGVSPAGAFDSVIVSMPIVTAAILRGISRAPAKNRSLMLGGVLAVAVALIVLVLRSISLAASRGPLFYYALLSSAILAVFAFRNARALSREVDGERSENS